MSRSLAALAALAILLSLPAAAAGTADAPELTDAAGDCAFAYGNEYADVVAAWISDETSTHFTVNLALAKWTADALGSGMGVTLQFEHQGVQFGVAASYFMPPMGGGWSYHNGYIDLDSGDSSGFVPTEGSFTPGTPALLTILFDKAHFPHGNSADNALRGFQAGSADFKYYVPWGVADQDPPAPAPGPIFGCDLATSDAVYTFQTGGHSTHDMGGAGMGAANATGDANATGPDGETGSGDVEPLATADANGNETPGAAPALLAAAVALVALALRRRA